MRQKGFLGIGFHRTIGFRGTGRFRKTMGVHGTKRFPGKDKVKRNVGTFWKQ